MVSRAGPAELLKVLALALAVSRPAFADFSKSNQMHHMFNANLLRPQETEVSIAGNFRIGIVDELEVGSQGVLLLVGLPNISIKHQMFRTRDFATAINGHILYISNNFSASDIDESTSSTKVSLMGGYIGSMTSWEMDGLDQLSLGVYDFFGRVTSSQLHSAVTLQAIAPAAAYDYYMSRSWALTGALAVPAFLYLSSKSDAADMDGFINFAGVGKASGQPVFGFLTGTWSGSVTNVEVGLLISSPTPSLYANVFWRFR